MTNEPQKAVPARRPRVIVVGGGFGGLSTARRLAGSEVEVLVLDRNNYHGFWPLLYQVATAGLEPESIAYPVRAILRRYSNVNFQMNEVHQIDLDNRRVSVNGGSLDYDYLVLSAGSVNNYFGNDRLAQTTYGLKDVDEAVLLRNHLLSAFEQAVQEEDPSRRAALMTFVVIGGGPTGVELAGAFSELIRHVLRKDYPMLDVSQAKVILIEGTAQLLGTFPPSLQKKATRKLEKMGVQVRLSAPVESVEHDCVRLKDGSELDSSTVVWAAGVRGAPLADKLNVKLGRSGRVPVEPALHLAQHPEVYVIGDMAYLEGYKPGVAYPMLAPVAIQQGECAARNILAAQRGQPLKPFRYSDRGSMATIGRRAAILASHGIRLSGFIAWVAWLLVHLISLIGTRNRLIVLTNWAYNYFTYERGARLILGPVGSPPGRADSSPAPVEAVKASVD